MGTKKKQTKIIKGTLLSLPPMPWPPPKPVLMEASSFGVTVTKTADEIADHTITVHVTGEIR